MFQRGFKSWCENVAVQLRKEIGLGATAPLDPYLLAETLGVKVWKAGEVPGVDAESLDILLRRDPDSWSAVMLHIGATDLVILNSSHSIARQASDLMHELAHIYLGHAPARIDVTEDGLLILNTFNKQQEEEAAWLAGCLLLPRGALMTISTQRIDHRTAAREYGVSHDMLEYRLKVTAVNMQLKRRHRMRA
jgi:Zn-dependent peptidase ImmA (M78 family)